MSSRRDQIVMAVELLQGMNEQGRLEEGDLVRLRLICLNPKDGPVAGINSDQDRKIKEDLERERLTNAVVHCCLATQDTCLLTREQALSLCVVTLSRMNRRLQNSWTEVAMVGLGPVFSPTPVKGPQGEMLDRAMKECDRKLTEAMGQTYYKGKQQPSPTTDQEVEDS